MPGLRIVATVAALAAAGGFLLGRVTVGTPAPDGSAALPSADHPDAAARVRALVVTADLGEIGRHGILTQQLADEILQARPDELPHVFRQIVWEDDYALDAMELLVRRWARGDAREIIGILRRHQGPNRWPGPNGGYLEALAAYELASTEPAEALAILEQCCRDDASARSGGGFDSLSPDELVADFYRRVAGIDLALAFRTAGKSIHDNEALVGTMLGAVESGRGAEAARLLDGLDEDRIDWPRRVLVRAWVRSEPADATRWFESLAPEVRSDLAADYTEARAMADSPRLDP